MKIIKVSSLIFVAILATGCMTGTNVKPMNATSSDKDLSDAVGYQTKIGNILLSRGDLVEAKKPFKKALSMDNKSIRANLGLALVFEKEKDPIEAEVYFKKALKIKKWDAQVNNNYGSFLYKQSRYAEACERFSMASRDKFYDKRSMTLNNAGLCYLKIKEPKEAMDQFRIAINLNASDKSAHMGMAQANLDVRDLKKSIKHIEIFRELNGSHTPISLQLAYELAVLKGDKAHAKVLKMLIDN
jgi:type IV pilus assembly protein PilF